MLDIATNVMRSDCWQFVEEAVGADPLIVRYIRRWGMPRTKSVLNDVLGRARRRAARRQSKEALA